MCLLCMFESRLSSMNTKDWKRKLECMWVSGSGWEKLEENHLPPLYEFLHTTMLCGRIISSVFCILFCLHAKGLPFPFCIGHNISHWWHMSIQEGLVLDATFSKINKLWVYLQGQSSIQDNKLNWQEQKQKVIQPPIHPNLHPSRAKKRYDYKKEDPYWPDPFVAECDQKLN